MDIDWSKAPADATHATNGTCGGNFYRFYRDFWQLWCRDEWVRSVDWEGFSSAPNCFIDRPSPWTGEGLPPVGTVCEFEVEVGDWRRCEVIAVKDDYAVCWIHVNKIFATGGRAIRPIRTPEHIAAEERDKAINQMEFDTGYLDRGAFTKLYDAGWRKQVKP